MSRRLSWLCTLGFLILPMSANADLIWHYEDRFSVEERQKLEAWIERVHGAVESLVAPFPFDVHIHFNRTYGLRGPVPWANTIRSRRQGVNFNVDPRYAAEQLVSDWTASHELSHLLIPYLGREHSWFAEGFASYMQYQVMQELGVITEAQAAARYQERINRAERRYDMGDMPFVEAAPKLRARRQYPTMYWGGAVYFLKVVTELRERDESVVDTVRKFVECCRRRTRGIDNLIAELDRLSGGTTFRDELDRVKTEPGFPSDDGVWAGSD